MQVNEKMASIHVKHEKQPFPPAGRTGGKETIGLAAKHSRANQRVGRTAYQSTRLNKSNVLRNHSHCRRRETGTGEEFLENALVECRCGIAFRVELRPDDEPVFHLTLDRLDDAVG